MNNDYIKTITCLLLLLLLLNTSMLKGDAINLNNIKLYISDIYTDQQLPVMQDTASAYTTEPKIIHPWQGVLYGGVTKSSIRSNNLDSYIKRPYRNPKILLQEQQQKQEQENIKNKETLAKMKEYTEKMNLICRNFYLAKRNKNSVIARPVIYHRKIMSFKRFAESCENYEKNNHFIWNGLNSNNIDF